MKKALISLVLLTAGSVVLGMVLAVIGVFGGFCPIERYAFAFTYLDEQQFEALDDKWKKVFPTNGDRLSRICYLWFDGTMIRIDNPFFAKVRLQKSLGLGSDQPYIRLPFENGTNLRVRGWTASRLPNRKIFIWGGSFIPDDVTEREGWTSSSKPLGQTWIYDENTRAFAAGPRMKVVCRDPNLLPLRDGRILITGGWMPDPKSKLNAIQIFDPKTKSISQIGKMCQPRYGHASCELDSGNILVISGVTTDELKDEQAGLNPTAELISLQDGRSRVVGRMNVPREDAIAIPYRDRQAIVFYGTRFTDDLSGDVIPADSAELFEAEKILPWLDL